MEKFLKYNINPEIDAKNPQQARFTIGPLEKGFGTTLGNSLRRTLLTCIPGVSVFAIKIANVTHEFQAIKGVKEDVTQIILNLKNLIIKIDENVYSDDELNALKIEQ
jgi:DNA-directed RNA polymerase subunit alpha